MASQSAKSHVTLKGHTSSNWPIRERAPHHVLRCNQGQGRRSESWHGGSEQVSANVTDYLGEIPMERRRHALWALRWCSFFASVAVAAATSPTVGEILTENPSDATQPIPCSSSQGLRYILALFWFCWLHHWTHNCQLTFCYDDWCNQP